MMDRLLVDIFFQDRYLLDVNVKARLVQSKNACALMAGGDDPDLFAGKAVQMGHIKALENGTAKYPLRSVDCKVFSIPRPRGAMSHTHENVYLGVSPKRVVLYCIDNGEYNGA